MKASRHGEILILLIVFTIAGTFAARRFPVLNPDEVIVMANAYSIMQGHGVRYFLNHDIYPQAISRLSDLSNHIARPFFDAALGPWVLLAHRRFEIVRLCSVAAGALTLLLFYLLGVQWRGRRLGFLFVCACLLNPVFLASCLVINEHLSLMTAGLGLLLAVKPLSHKLGWHSYLWGFLSAALFFVHQNGLVLWMSLFVFGMLTCAKERRSRWALLTWAGCISGVLLFVRTVDLPRMILFQKAIYWAFAKPPIFEWPWHPWSWITAMAHLLAGGPTYYFFHEGPPLSGGWGDAQAVYWISLATAVAAATFKNIKERSGSLSFFYPLSLSLGAGIILMAMLIRRQEVFYVLALLPMAIPLFGISAEWLLSNARWTFAATAFIAGSAPFLFLCFAQDYSRRCETWPAIQAQIKSLAPAESGNILAPNVLWAEFPVAAFRDIGATVTARYYGDKSSLGVLVSGWKPRVLIADSSFRRAYGIGPQDPVRLSRLLGRPVAWRGSIDTKEAYGVWDMYAIDWTQPL